MHRQEIQDAYYEATKPHQERRRERQARAEIALAWARGKARGEYDREVEAAAEELRVAIIPAQRVYNEAIDELNASIVATQAAERGD